MPGCGQKFLFVCYHLCNIERAVEVVKIYRVKADMKPVFQAVWVRLMQKKIKGFANDFWFILMAELAVIPGT